MASVVDRTSVTDSKLRFIVAQALKAYSESDLFEFASDSDTSLRTLAACEIQMRGTPTCFEFAKSLVESDRYDEREIGAFILGQLGPPSYVYLEHSLLILANLLRDPYYEVRATAVGSLGFLTSGSRCSLSSVQEKIFALRYDSAAPVREALAFTLGFIKNIDSNHILNTLTEDPSTNVREAAEFGLDLHSER